MSAGEATYTAADLAEAFQAGLTLGQRAAGRSDAGYGEGFLDGSTAARNAAQDGPEIYAKGLSAGAALRSADETVDAP